jgi:hypothetical protein
MKLVCFSNNTGGGILCDLLNGNTPTFNQYKVTNFEHKLFHISDTPTIERNFDHKKWTKIFNKLSADSANKDVWAGTHYHPSIIPNLEKFSSVIAITTESRQSKLYRWLRYYYGWFRTTEPTFIENKSLDSIDKVRCLAKNVFEPFEADPRCDNYEFSTLVDGALIEKLGLNQEIFRRWKERNPWLYDHSLYQWGIDRFNEAEYEITTNLPYKYI